MLELSQESWVAVATITALGSWKNTNPRNEVDSQQASCAHVDWDTIRLEDTREI